MRPQKKTRAEEARFTEIQTKKPRKISRREEITRDLGRIQKDKKVVEKIDRAREVTQKEVVQREIEKREGKKRVVAEKGVVAREAKKRSVSEQPVVRSVAEEQEPMRNQLQFVGSSGLQQTTKMILLISFLRSLNKKMVKK